MKHTIELLVERLESLEDSLVIADKYISESEARLEEDKKFKAETEEKIADVKEALKALGVETEKAVPLFEVNEKLKSISISVPKIDLSKTEIGKAIEALKNIQKKLDK